MGSFLGHALHTLFMEISSVIFAYNKQMPMKTGWGTYQTYVYHLGKRTMNTNEYWYFFVIWWMCEKAIIANVFAIPT